MQEMIIRALCGIRTRNPSNHAAAYTRLKYRMVIGIGVCFFVRSKACREISILGILVNILFSVF
jgi:hypothetical protein